MKQLTALSVLLPGQKRRITPVELERDIIAKTSHLALSSGVFFLTGLGLLLNEGYGLI